MYSIKPCSSTYSTQRTYSTISVTDECNCAPLPDTLQISQCASPQLLPQRWRWLPVPRPPSLAPPRTGRARKAHAATRSRCALSPTGCLTTRRSAWMRHQSATRRSTAAPAPPARSTSRTRTAATLPRPVLRRRGSAMAAGVCRWDPNTTLLASAVKAPKVSRTSRPLSLAASLDSPAKWMRAAERASGVSRMGELPLRPSLLRRSLPRPDARGGGGGSS